MGALADLFPEGKRARDASAVLDDRHTLRRLDALYGDRRADTDVTHRASDRRDLVGMVQTAVSDAAPLASTPPSAISSGPRRRRRVDVLSLLAGGVAVAALVVATTVGAVQAATASPASDAMIVLEADEKTIQSATEGLSSARSRVQDEIAAADASAASLKTNLAGAREVPSPRGASPVPISDTAQLDGMLSAVDTYRDALAAITLPELPPAYERGKVDPASLSDVGAAIDVAQEHLNLIDRETAAVREDRNQLAELRAAFEAKTTTFAKTVPDVASDLIDANPEASEAARSAAISAAESVASVDLATDVGADALAAYGAAVSVVLQEQFDVELQREREARERELRESQQYTPPSGGSGTSPTDPTDPPTEPTDPVQPTDPPVDSEDPPAGG